MDRKTLALAIATIVVTSDQIVATDGKAVYVPSEISDAMGSLASALTREKLSDVEVVQDPGYTLTGQQALVSLREHLPQQPMPNLQNVDLLGYAATLNESSRKVRANARAAHRRPIEEIVPRKPTRDVVGQLANLAALGCVIYFQLGDQKIMIEAPAIEDLATPKAPDKKELVSILVTGCDLRPEVGAMITLEYEFRVLIPDADDTWAVNLLAQHQRFTGCVVNTGGHWVIDSEKQFSFER